MISNLKELASDLLAASAAVDRVPELEEQLKVARCELDRWKTEALRLGTRGDMGRDYSRDSIVIRMSVDRSFLHFSRDPDEIVRYQMHEMSRQFGGYLKGAGLVPQR